MALSLQQAQADMRSGYRCGAPGLLVSGLVWLIAGLVAASGREAAAVLVLLAGGALIHPLAVLLARASGRSGRHASGNPLGPLAVEGTLWLLAGIAAAWALRVLRLEWFFPAMLLAIGGRYLTFQTLYGLRWYWACGGALCVAGMALGVLRAAPAAGALAGAAIELSFAALALAQSRRGT